MSKESSNTRIKLCALLALFYAKKRKVLEQCVKCSQDEGGGS